MGSSKKRVDGESFEDFRKRREQENQKARIHLLGRVFWDSCFIGTYVRPDEEGK